VSEGSPARKPEQDRTRVTVADFFTALRLPLAVAFVLEADPGWRLSVLFIAGGSDLLDGWLARRYGSSRFGGFIDPVADKLFMAAAFGVVLWSEDLAIYEVIGVLLRDIVATVAFVATAFSGRARSIPARLGGKAVTLAQMLTLFAFVVESPLLRPLAWATAAIALYAIWDYTRVAPKEERAL
jgi:cardiolipin synthase